MKAVAEQLKKAKTAISFSSGFFGFYHHAGVLLALDELGIKPIRAAGTSAGAIVAAMYACGIKPDKICNELTKIKRSDFWDLHFPFTKTGFGLLKGKKFEKALATILTADTFEECSLPLSLGAYCLSDGRPKQLSDGPLIPAVLASCAVPYLFPPVEISGKKYLDGGFAEKTPLGHLVHHNDIDTVIVSYMPPREENPRQPALFKKSFQIFAGTPPEERIERDRSAIKILRESGKRVFLLSLKRIWLGPFSLNRAQEAMNFGKSQSLQILNSNDETPFSETVK
jgi:NTE family protein